MSSTPTSVHTPSLHSSSTSIDASADLAASPTSISYTEITSPESSPKMRAPTTNLIPILSPQYHPETSIVIFNGFYRHLIHQELLFAKAPFFKSLLPGQFLPVPISKTVPGTGIQATIRLPYATPDITLPREIAPTNRVFLAFMDWLYNGNAFLERRENDAPTLIQLWVFAERVNAPLCQNACIEGIERRRQESGIIETAMLAWVYNNTRQNFPSGLKNLLVDQCVWKIDPQWLLSFDCQFPKDALVDIVVRMRALFHSRDHSESRCPFSTMVGRKETYWVRPFRWNLCNGDERTIVGEDIHERTDVDAAILREKDLTALDKASTLTSSEGEDTIYAQDEDHVEERLVKAGGVGTKGFDRLNVKGGLKDEHMGKLADIGYGGVVKMVDEERGFIGDYQVLGATRSLSSLRGP